MALRKGGNMNRLTVEQIRRLLGYSQIKMARYLGICQNSYINKEKGKSKFTAPEAAKICELSGRQFEEIIFFK